MSFDSVSRRFEPLPKHKVLSKRYPSFDAVYQKTVEAAQAIVAKAEALQKPYTVFTDALEALNLTNDTRVIIDGSSVIAYIKTLPTDSSFDLEKWTRQVGHALVKAGLHNDGLPSLNKCDWLSRFTYTWRFDAERKAIIQFEISVTEGLADIMVERKTVETTSTVLTYVLRNQATDDLQINPDGSLRVQDFKEMMDNVLTKAFSGVVNMDVGV